MVMSPRRVPLGGIRKQIGLAKENGTELRSPCIGGTSRPVLRREESASRFVSPGPVRAESASAHLE